MHSRPPTPNSASFWPTLLLVVVCLALGACASRAVSEPLTRMPTTLRLNELKRDDYRILGDTEARSCATFVGLFPLPVWYVTADAEVPGEKPDFWLFGVSVDGRAKSSARYKALARAWLADSLIAPREHSSTRAVYPWYKRVCVTVRGKAIRLKADEPGATESQIPNAVAP